MTAEQTRATDIGLKLLITICLGACGLLLNDIRENQSAERETRLIVTGQLAKIETQIANIAKQSEASSTDIRSITTRLDDMDHRVTIIETRARR